MFTWHFPEHTKPPAALPEFTFVLNTSVGTSIEGEADRNEQQGPGVDQININTLCLFSHSVVPNPLWPMDCSPPGFSFREISIYIK